MLVYLDDILTCSRSIDEHWVHLRPVLEHLRAAKLYGRLHKCDFLKSRVDYLRIDIFAEGVHVSLEKVKYVVQWPTPRLCTMYDHFWGLLPIIGGSLGDSVNCSPTH